MILIKSATILIKIHLTNQSFSGRQVEVVLGHTECLVLTTLVNYGRRPGQRGSWGIEEGHPCGVQDPQDRDVRALHVQTCHE